MIKIYRLTPVPIEIGLFDNGILNMKNQNPVKATRDKILDRFNRGYYRCGEVE